jgi:Anti-sigma-K factor rskA
MINVKEYTESGILEDYLAGNVTDQERREVECLSKIYPEIKLELDQLGDALEKYAQAHSKIAPASLKNKIMEQLTFLDEANEEEATDNQLVEATSATPVIPLGSANRITTQPYWSWVAAAACFVAGCLGYVAYQQGAKLTQAETAMATKEAELQTQTQTLAAFNGADNQFITLKGVEKSPNSAVRVVWNPKTQDVYLNTLSLPEPTADKQYQLWCLVGGKPVDLGVFDVKTALQKMKAAPQADAFAVTLEKRGGSASPTLSEMYVLGKVSG